MKPIYNFESLNIEFHFEGNQNPAVENSDVIDLKITQSNNNDLNNNSHDNDSIPSFKKEVDTIK